MNKMEYSFLYKEFTVYVKKDVIGWRANSIRPLTSFFSIYDICLDFSRFMISTTNFYQNERLEKEDIEASIKYARGKIDHPIVAA